MLRLHHGFIAQPEAAVHVMWFAGFPSEIPSGHLSLFKWKRMPSDLVQCVMGDVAYHGTATVVVKICVCVCTAASIWPRRDPVVCTGSAAGLWKSR